MEKVPLVAIIGAGIAGLATARALALRGVEATIFEQAPQLAEIGAALAINPNGLVALERLGLAEAARSAGAGLNRVVIASRRGRTLSDIRFGTTLGIHRAALQHVLLDSGSVVTLGTRIEEFAQDEAGVTVGGSCFDLVVGADGIRSRVRESLFGPEPLRDAGYYAWRAIAPRPADGLPIKDAFVVFVGAGSQVGYMPIDADRVYWFASLNARPGEPRPADAHEEALRRFGAWPEPLPQLITATPRDAVLVTDLHDRRPRRCWHDGRVVLVGDAAHPMTPNLGQGACQALEDAVVLAAALEAEPTVERALARFSDLRVRRPNSMVRASRQMGRILQLESPAACAVRDAIFRATPASIQRWQNARLARVTLPA
ncbi:MAG: FAD-dependent oxidoreductase [Dehalococcoidia bacterium]